jgi:hypothetical protein
MASFRIYLDQETSTALLKRALAELRSVDSQAVVLLRQSLGLPVPYPDDDEPVAPTLASGEAKGA